jgi:hypothetical protein
LDGLGMGLNSWLWWPWSHSARMAFRGVPTEFLWLWSTMDDILPKFCPHSLTLIPVRKTDGSRFHRVLAFLKVSSQSHHIFVVVEKTCHPEIRHTSSQDQGSDTRVSQNLMVSNFGIPESSRIIRNHGNHGGIMVKTP